MKQFITKALVGFFLVTGLAACKTVSAIKEDFNSITGREPEPVVVPSDRAAEPVVVPSDRRVLVEEVQNMLADKGYDPGPADGQAGPSTKSALRAFQTGRGLTVTDGVTREAYIQLASDNAPDSTTQDNAPHSTAQSSQEGQPECERNFTKQSGLRNYRTTAFLNDVSQQLAVKRLARQLGRDGFVIHENDETRGTLNATFDTGGGTGIQISAFIDKDNGGSQAELNYVGTGAGLSTLFVPTSLYKADLCEYIDVMLKGG